MIFYGRFTHVFLGVFSANFTAKLQQQFLYDGYLGFKLFLKLYNCERQKIR